MFKKVDFLVITTFLAIALLLFFMPKGDMADYFYIYKNNALYEKVSAAKAQTIVIDDGENMNVLQIENGMARMIEASCPDGVCLSQRAISHENEMIVCIPNSVIVEVSGKQGKLDGVSY